MSRLIPDIEKFLPVAIFKMAATIPQKFNIVRYHQTFNVGNQFGTSLSTHISNFDDIGQCLIFAVLWQPF
jgi:hypothetical protein